MAKIAQRNIPFISPTYVEAQVVTNFAKLKGGMPWDELHGRTCTGTPNTFNASAYLMLTGTFIGGLWLILYLKKKMTVAKSIYLDRVVDLHHCG